MEVSCKRAMELLEKIGFTRVAGSQEELQAAAMLCGRLGIPHVVLPAEEFSVDAFRFNRKDRCYHCKKNIMTTFLSYAKEHHIDTVLDGTNADDLGEDRPGLKAAAELSVGKPLADCGVTKQEVYLLLERFGLTDYIKPSMSCLATRFPVGEELTKEKLARCWELEDQYMFGNRYLVAPILQLGQREREVYLPAGNWKSIADDQTCAGGQTIVCPAPLDRIPVFERSV